MATKLFLRTTTNAFTTGGVPLLSGDVALYDMLPSAGSGSGTLTVTPASGGTEIQWGYDGPSFPNRFSFISGRVNSTFTLTSTDISGWFSENAMTDNCGGRYRVFKWQPGNILTELGGGPFDDGVEFSVSPTVTEMTWSGNVTDTQFVEDERIVLRVYITNIGTMGSNRCFFEVDGADGTQGDSFFNLAETVTFKSETDPPARRKVLNKSGMQAVKRANFF